MFWLVLGLLAWMLAAVTVALVLGAAATHAAGRPRAQTVPEHVPAEWALAG